MPSRLGAMSDHNGVYPVLKREPEPSAPALTAVDSAQSNTSSPDSSKDALEEDSKTPHDSRHVVEDIAQGKTIVGWDGPDDPENPRNWSTLKKLATCLLISLDTTSLYMGSAIVTPASGQLQEYFGTTQTKTALGVSLFVWGYGFGSLWFTPMSEIPLFRGRNPTYLGAQLMFTILQIPAALTTNLGGYAVIRFLSGVFAAPPLSTAGATINDVWDMPHRFIALMMWEFGCVAGPFLGPLVGAALSQNQSFRYIFWFLLALSGGLFVLMILFLPETSEQQLLINKAKRLRKQLNRSDLIAPGEILMHQQKASDILKDMFFKPIKITIMEPVVALIDLHLGLLYSVTYLFLEALPLVYRGLYGFNLVQVGCAFQPLMIGSLIACVLYATYILCHQKNMDQPEKVFGIVAITGASLLPTGLLVWGWLEREDIHWAIGMIGNVLIAISSFFMFQSYFSFLSTMFPPNAVGSAYASNNIVRALMGGAFPLFGHAFFHNTSTSRYPVGWGCSILALAAVIMISLPIYLYFKGAELRAYAQKKYGDKLLSQ